MRGLFRSLRRRVAGLGKGEVASPPGMPNPIAADFARSPGTAPPDPPPATAGPPIPVTATEPLEPDPTMATASPTSPAAPSATSPGPGRNGDHGPPFALNKEQAQSWLRQMELIRRFEERSAMLYQNKEIFGFLHLYSGQESVAVGSLGALRDDDYVITAYRDHAHALLRGMTARAGMAEMMGKAAGCAKGKGGSMHFFQAENRFLGGHAIVGGHVPLAAGVAWKIKYRKEDSVCICYFGDGAMNQGPVHEAFNMAAMWKLPAIWIMENNQYSMGTSLERSSAILDFTIRGGAAYGTPGITIDGSDTELVAKTVAEAAARARAGKGPTFIEVMTYRYRGHSMADPGKYRTQDEIERVRSEKDPIERFIKLMRERGWFDEAAYEAMRDQIKEEVDEAIEFAQAAPYPELSEIYDDITVAPFVPQESSDL